MLNLNREQFQPLDLDAIRSEHSLPSVAGAVVKLQRAGSEWKACCPFHQDRSPSFTIFSGGERFHCFGCGVSGDVLDFVQRLHGVSLRYAAEMLTGGLPTVEVQPVLSNDTTSNRVDDARDIWRSSQPVKGTLAENYLRSRSIDIALPESLRFASLRYGSKGREHPCMVAAVGSADRKFQGIQRTYLNADGTGKLDVPKPKLSLGRVSGGAIRLAPCAGSLVICEGIEDGLSLMQGLGQSVWVAAGASMLPAMRFPPMVKSVRIGGDNDEAGRAAADKAARAFAERGLEARVFFPAGAKDFNEELMKGSRP